MSKLGWKYRNKPNNKLLNCLSFFPPTLISWRLYVSLRLNAAKRFFLLLLFWCSIIGLWRQLILFVRIKIFIRNTNISYTKAPHVCRKIWSICGTSYWTEILHKIWHTKEAALIVVKPFRLTKKHQQATESSSQNGMHMMNYWRCVFWLLF